MGTGRRALVALAVVALGCPDRAEQAAGPPPSAPARPSASIAAAPATSASAAAVVPLRDLPEADAALPAAQADTLVAPEGLRLELLDAGGVPRQELRARLTPRDPVHLILHVELAVAVTLAGNEVEQPVPPMRIALKTELAAPQGARGERLAVTLEEVTLEPKDAKERAVAAEMQPHLDGLRGARCELAVGARGRTGPPSMPPEVAGGPAAQLWSTIGEALRELALPLPAEAVGRGAEWQVFERLHRGGVEMLRRTRYRLLAREGGRVELRGSIRELPIAGGRVDPAAPREIRIVAEQGSSQGEHLASRALVAGPLWIASESKLQSRLSTQTTHAGAPGRPVSGQVEIEQKLRVERASSKGKSHGP